MPGTRLPAVGPWRGSITDQVVRRWEGGGLAIFIVTDELYIVGVFFPQKDSCGQAAVDRRVCPRFMGDHVAFNSNGSLLSRLQTQCAMKIMYGLSEYTVVNLIGVRRSEGDFLNNMLKSLSLMNKENN